MVSRNSFDGHGPNHQALQLQGNQALCHCWHRAQTHRIFLVSCHQVLQVWFHQVSRPSGDWISITKSSKCTWQRTLVTKKVVETPAGALTLAISTGVSGATALYYGTDQMTTLLGVGNIVLCVYLYETKIRMEYMGRCHRWCYTTCYGVYCRNIWNRIIWHWSIVIRIYIIPMAIPTFPCIIMDV